MSKICSVLVNWAHYFLLYIFRKILIHPREAEKVVSKFENRRGRPFTVALQQHNCDSELHFMQYIRSYTRKIARAAEITVYYLVILFTSSA